MQPGRNPPPRTPADVEAGGKYFGIRLISFLIKCCCEILKGTEQKLKILTAVAISGSILIILTGSNIKKLSYRFKQMN